jgi:hypothetical protein
LDKNQFNCSLILIKYMIKKILLMFVVLYCLGFGNYIFGQAFSLRDISFVGAARTIPAGGGGGVGTVTFDAVGTTNGVTGAGPTTYLQLTNTHVVGSSLVNSYLVVGIAHGFGTQGTNAVTNVTCAGTAMTLITNRAVGGSAHGMTYLYGLTNVSAGSKEIIISPAGGLAATEETYVAGSISFQGVNQATPYSNAVGTNGNSTTPSCIVSSADNNAIVAVANSGSDFSAWATTDRWHKNYSSSSGGGNGAMSSAAGAATVTKTWTTGSDSWSVSAANLNHD